MPYRRTRNHARLHPCNAAPVRRRRSRAGGCASYRYRVYCCCFFFKDTATTGIYTLSLHDALPIFSARRAADTLTIGSLENRGKREERARAEDRKSTRLNSSHVAISYTVFCLK